MGNAGARNSPNRNDADQNNDDGSTKDEQETQGRFGSTTMAANGRYENRADSRSSFGGKSWPSFERRQRRPDNANGRTSPVRKRFRADESLSLPTVIFGRQSVGDSRSSTVDEIAGLAVAAAAAADSTPNSTPTPTIMAPPPPPQQLPMSSSSSVDKLRNDMSKSDEFNMSAGPITKAVLRSGIRAKFKSFSSWLLHEPTKMRNSSSFPTGFDSSVKRWGSLGANWKLGSRSRREPSRRSSLLSTPARSRNGEQSSVGSLNSLSDGRTPWPTPWLEAIFLPEFSSKSSVNEKTFAIIGTIAKGAFGKVYRVSLRAQPECIFAMKVQGKADVITQNAVKQIKDEVSIHQIFNDYPFIAQLYCSWQSRSKLYMVLHYVGGYGDLYQLWRDEGPFREDAVRIWGAELAMTIDYMHASGVIYRDLKMENIMLDDNGHLQLVDFGLAKWLYYGDRTGTICGTLQYMAPEVLKGEPYNHAVDWWSLGVLLHSLLAGSYPYSSAGDHTTVKIDEYTPPAALSVEAQTLLAKLLRKDPMWRLRSFTVYKTQPFFQRIDFDEIRNKKIHPFDYIPRMRRCDTCNMVTEEEGLEDTDLTMFEENYDAFKNFDSFGGEVGL